MKEIKRITITSHSGNVTMDGVYEDKLSITAESIIYEYKPFRPSAENPHVKWSHRTNSAEYAKQFKAICKLTEKAFTKKRNEAYDDVGAISFCITYTDSTRTVRETDAWDKSFTELFDAIRKLIPQSEKIPVVTME